MPRLPRSNDPLAHEEHRRLLRYAALGRVADASAMVEVETATGCGALADLNRAVENPLLAMLREQSATRQSFEMLNGGLSPFMVAIAGTASGALAELRRAGGSPGSDMLDEQRSAVREALEVLAGNGSSAIAALAGNRELFE